MITLAQVYLLPLILAFIIGVATGWWMWARAVHTRLEDYAYAGGADDVVTADQANSFDTNAPESDAIALAKVLPFAPSDIKPRRVRERKAVQKLTSIGISVAVGPDNDLLQIKGIGPKLNALLNGLGILRFDQIAAWKTKEISAVDRNLGAFQGRIVRDNWVDQASLLALGQIATFEARYGKLDSENQ